MIYFLRARARGPIKIGTTESFGARLRALRDQCGPDIEVLGIMQGGRPREKELHLRFASLKAGAASRCEWFKPGADLLSFIAAEATPWDGLPTTFSVSIPLSISDRSTLRVMAAEAGMSMASYARAVLLREIAAYRERKPRP